jgi:hypothetical protein
MSVLRLARTSEFCPQEELDAIVSLQLGDGGADEVAGVLAARRVVGAQVAGAGVEPGRGSASVGGDLGMHVAAAAVRDGFCGDQAVAAAEGKADELVGQPADPGAEGGADGACCNL